MKLKQTLLSLCGFAMLTALTTNLNAQVTIGSTEKPNAGALLDLKDGGIYINGETANKGLAMPRVELTKLTPTTPAELSASIGSTGNWDLAAHIGLIVYNVKDAVFDPITCKTEGAGPAGLYIWDGSKWQGLGIKGGDPLESETATSLTDREGNTYPISTFGAAGTWMTQNLRTTTAPGLTAMIESAEHSTTDMHYAYPNGGKPYTGKPNSWTAREGIHYNWQATMDKVTCNITNQGQVAGTTPGVNEVETTDGFIQGICPFGWHVPSDRDWNLLEKEIAEKTSLYSLSTPDGSWDAAWETAVGWRGTLHGKAMKSTTQLTSTAPGGDSKTSGDTGLDLLLVGYGSYGSTHIYGPDTYLWSSSSFDDLNAWNRAVFSNFTNMNRDVNNRNVLFPVRCKKN